MPLLINPLISIIYLAIIFLPPPSSHFRRPSQRPPSVRPHTPTVPGSRGRLRGSLQGAGPAGESRPQLSRMGMAGGGRGGRPPLHSEGGTLRTPPHIHTYMHSQLEGVPSCPVLPPTPGSCLLQQKGLRLTPTEHARLDLAGALSLPNWFLLTRQSSHSVPPPPPNPHHHYPSHLSVPPQERKKWGFCDPNDT